MLVLAVVLTQVVSLVSSHGNMVVPLTWHDTEQMGLQIGKKDPGCVKEDLPDHDETDDWPTIHGRTVCQNEWFTNHTYIPGEATIPEDMLGEGGHGKNPWFAPGTAPVYSPCGTYGGNPLVANQTGRKSMGTAVQGTGVEGLLLVQMPKILTGLKPQ